MQILIFITSNAQSKNVSMKCISILFLVVLVKLNRVLGNKRKERKSIIT
jgi:hypothetical protein